MWVEYFCKILKNNKLEYNWIDIELEIKNVIVFFDNYEYECKYILQYQNYKDITINDFKLKVNEIAESSCKCEDIGNGSAWELFKIRMKNDYDEFIRAFELYLRFMIRYDGESIKSYKSHTGVFDGLSFDLLISFNYTHTYKMIYQENIDSHYIHGYIRYDGGDVILNHKNNIVLGIEEYLSDDEKNKKLDFVEYRKYYQRILKNNDFGYKRKLADFKSDNQQVYTYFYGHSISITDKDILKDFLPLPNNEIDKTYICYHDEYSLKSIIVNLILILGQNEVEELTRSADPRLIFVSKKN